MLVISRINYSQRRKSETERPDSFLPPPSPPPPSIHPHNTYSQSSLYWRLLMLRPSLKVYGSSIRTWDAWLIDGTMYSSSSSSVGEMNYSDDLCISSSFVRCRGAKDEWHRSTGTLSCQLLSMFTPSQPVSHQRLLAVRPSDDQINPFRPFVSAHSLLKHQHRSPYLPIDIESNVVCCVLGRAIHTTTTANPKRQ